MALRRPGQDAGTPAGCSAEPQPGDQVQGVLQRRGRAAPGADWGQVDLGVDIISMRGYDLLADAIDIGRHVIPIVREEVAKRDQAAAAAEPAN